jgi:hypothetical protein
MLWILDKNPFLSARYLADRQIVELGSTAGHLYAAAASIGLTPPANVPKASQIGPVCSLLVQSWRTDKLALKWVVYTLIGMAYEYQQRFGAYHPAWLQLVTWGEPLSKLEIRSLPGTIRSDSHPIFGEDKAVITYDLVKYAATADPILEQLLQAEGFEIPPYAEGVCTIDPADFRLVMAKVREFPQVIPKKFRGADVIEAHRKFFESRLFNRRWRHGPRPSIWKRPPMRIIEIDI